MSENVPSRKLIAVIEKVVDRSFHWLSFNLNRFEPLQTGSGPAIAPLKAFAELAFLCSKARLICPEQFRNELVSASKFVDSHAKQPALENRLLLQPSLFLLYGNIFTAVEQWSIGEQAWHARLQALIDTGYITAMETAPFRRLDLHNMLDAAGYRHDLPTPTELYKATLAYSMPSVLYLTDEDVYSVTHAIFYVGNFGLVDLQPLLGVRYDETVWYVCTILGIYLRKGNWDIVLELLICCVCLNVYSKPLIELAWRTVAEMQFIDGEFPGPTFNPAKLEKLEPLQQDRYRFDENYHTSLVGLGASLAFLNKISVKVGSE